MADIFISYAHEDETRIQPVAHAIEQRGWTVFWDRRIPAGQTWRSYIGQALIDARCVVVAWSQYSIASNWVAEEAEEGKKRGILIPILLDSVEPPIGFRSIQAGNLVNWQHGYASPHFDQFIQDIESVLSAPLPLPRTPQPSEREAERSSDYLHQQRTPQALFRPFASALIIAFLVLAVGLGYWGYRRWNGGSNSTTPTEMSESAAKDQVITARPSSVSDIENSRATDISKSIPKEQPKDSRPLSVSDIKKPFAWVLDRTQKLQVIDREGSQVKKIAAVNIDLSIGGNRVISASHDGKFVVAVNAYDAVDRLARYNIDGSIAWSIKTGSYDAVCVAKTGYSYAIKRGSKESRGDIVQKIDNETGKIEKQFELSQKFFDIVVDEKKENVWIAGQAITRLDLDLNEKWTSDPIGWYAVSIDYAPDGTLLVAERKYKEGLGQDRLLRINAGGKVENSIPLEFRPSRVVVSRWFWDVWVAGEKVVRFNPKDPSWDRPMTLDIGPAGYADVARDGSAWIAARNRIVKMSRKGDVVGELPGLLTEKICFIVISGG